MATFRGIRRAVTALHPLIKHRQLSVSACARAEWNKDWLPSKYPVSKEEKEIAAKKYGLLPEDYDAYPDDGMGSGDYPKLPDIGADSKSDWEPYDMPALKRNYKEPLHYHFDAYGEDRYNPSEPIQYTYMPYWKQALVLASVFAVAFGITIFAPLKVFYPLMPKQYPYGELYLEKGGDRTQSVPEIKHYSFEPAE